MCAIGISGLVLMTLSTIALAQGNSQADSGQQISGTTTAASEGTSNIQDAAKGSLDPIYRQLFEMSTLLGEISSRRDYVYPVLGILTALFIFLFTLLNSRLLKLETKFDTKFDEQNKKFDEQNKVIGQMRQDMAQIYTTLNLLVQLFGIRSILNQTQEGFTAGAGVNLSSPLVAMRPVEPNSSNAVVGQPTASSPSDPTAS
jgi:uncharacterized coiled-coil protein SlyX